MERFQGVDPGLQRLAEARRLAAAALRDLFGDKNYVQAQDRAAKAARMAPNDADVQIKAASVHSWIAHPSFNGGRLSDQEKGVVASPNRPFAPNRATSKP
jgi:hypothetical protein